MALDFPDAPTDGQFYNGFTWSSTDGVWRITKPLLQPTVEFLIVSCGGAGGGYVGGGGGGGGVVTSSSAGLAPFASTGSFNITIGAGAASIYSRGGASSLGTIFTIGGGGGTGGGNAGGAGSTGGSGGGGGSSPGLLTGYAGTLNQGFAGGGLWRQCEQFSFWWWWWGEPGWRYAPVLKQSRR